MDTAGGTFNKAFKTDAEVVANMADQSYGRSV